MYVYIYIYMYIYTHTQKPYCNYYGPYITDADWPLAQPGLLLATPLDVCFWCGALSLQLLRLARCVGFRDLGVRECVGVGERVQEVELHQSLIAKLSYFFLHSMQFSADVDWDPPQQQP